MNNNKIKPFNSEEESIERFDALTPEEKMLISIIDVAVLDANKPVMKINEDMDGQTKDLIAAQNRLIKRSNYWLKSDNTKIFSCNWICEQLDIDKSKILELIK